MTTRPADSPRFATDVTLDVGAGLDAGLAPRNDPGDLVRGQGFHPSKLPARWLNHELGAHGDWIDYLDDLAAQKAMREWRREILPGALSDTYEFLLGIPIAGKARAVMAVGKNLAGTDSKFIKADLGGFEAAAGSSTIDPPAAACASVAGAWVHAVAPNAIAQFTNFGGSNTSYSSGASTIAAVHHAPGSATPYLVAFTNGFTKNATFGSGTAASSPAGLTAIPAASLGAPGGEFSDDGGSNVVFACSCTISGSTRFRILNSVDGGATWGSALTLPAGTLSLNVGYSAVFNGFVATYEETAGVFKVATSPNGAAWTVRATTTFPSGLATFHGSMAVSGHCVAKIIVLVVGTVSHAGVAYTLDLGNTWRYALLDTTGQTPVRLVAINDRILLTVGDGTVYTSGALETRAADLP